MVAVEYNVPLWVVNYWESGTDCPHPLPRMGKVKPTVGELCYVARRREGMTLREAARALETSHVRIIKFEREGEDPTPLQEFWQNMGYDF